MTSPIKLTTATDLDAAYVLGRMADADKADADAKQCDGDAQAARKRASQARLDAGQRLIEVRTRFLASGQQRCPDFARWLETTGIAQATASEYMRDAGFTEEQRTEHKAKKAADKREKRAKEPKPFHMRWLAAMAQFSGVYLPSGFGGTQKKLLDKEFGTDVAKMTFHTEQEARDFAARGALAFKQHVPDTVAKTDAAKLQRAIDAEIAKIRKGAQAQLHEAVTARTEEMRKEFGEAIDAARRKQDMYDNMAKDLHDWMTYEDYQIVISCLHPDRAPPGMEERYRKAFQIMNALKKRFNR